MKKFLTTIFSILIFAALCFGQAIVVQAQQEWNDFYYELNSAARRFCFTAAS